MKKRILFIHHHSKFGGSSKSLVEAILLLKKDYDISILCPLGSSLRFFKKNKIYCFPCLSVPCFDLTEIGIYKKFRLLLLIREFFAFPLFLINLLYIKFFYKFDIIHLNDSNLIILSPLLKKIYNIPIVCHIRTILFNKNFFFKNLFIQISEKYISYFLCIDKACKDSVYFSSNKEIIYNIYNFDKNNFFKKKDNCVRFGFIGSLDYNKGIDFFFKVIEYINNFKKLKIKFFIAGNLSVKNNLLAKILDLLKIKKNINNALNNFKNKNFTNTFFLGEIQNLNNFYNNLDVICFPSRMNALGRPIIEASHYKIPSIVCLKKYHNDTIIDNKTGYVVRFGNLYDFVKKTEYFCKNKIKINTLGKNAYINIVNVHNKKKNINKLKKIYNKL
jgi:glycosyltransferase involved in cell wall biosynthesis